MYYLPLAVSASLLILLNKMTVENYLETNLRQFSPEVQEVVTQVLQLEKKKLYQKAPRHINEDVLKVIKDVVQ